HEQAKGACAHWEEQQQFNTEENEQQEILALRQYRAQAATLDYGKAGADHDNENQRLAQDRIEGPSRGTTAALDRRIQGLVQSGLAGSRELLRCGGVQLSLRVGWGGPRHWHAAAQT